MFYFTGTKWDSQIYIRNIMQLALGSSNGTFVVLSKSHNVGLCKLGTKTLLSSSSLHFGRPFGNTPSFRSHWVKAISKTFHCSFCLNIFSQTSLIPGRRFRHTLHSLSLIWTLWTQLITLFICNLKPRKFPSNTSNRSSSFESYLSV